MNKTIYQTILERKLNARKKKAATLVQLLTFLQGEFERAGKDIDDAKALKILKGLKISLEAALVPNNSQAAFELGYVEGLILQFEPEQLSDHDIRFHLTETLCANIDSTPPTLGGAQKFFKEKFPGQYEGANLTKLYKELYG